MRAKIQQNLRICKFCIEKVLGVLKVKYFLADGSVRAKLMSGNLARQINAEN